MRETSACVVGRPNEDGDGGFNRELAQQLNVPK